MDFEKSAINKGIGFAKFNSKIRGPFICWPNIPVLFRPKNPPARLHPLAHIA